MAAGPQPISPERRRQTVQEIAQALQAHYQDRLLALGVYGSLARLADGPFSDIEMHCILHGEGIDQSFEWSTGPWKAEVDVCSPDVILAQAAEVDGDWSITHGAYVNVWPLFDPQAFFPRLKETALSQPDEVFRFRMKEVIVGDLYELIGKVRNAWAIQTLSPLPGYATFLARDTACMVGLARRYLYHSFATMLEEALALPDSPKGFSNVCQRVMSGRLSSSQAIVKEVNTLWDGIELWAKEKQITLTDHLDDLLHEDPLINH